MLNLVKTTGGYNGVEYNNPGPAHLSAGQEAAAVGMAYNLDTDDFIFGSHRSHGEILAKGLRSIQILPEKELKKIMEEFWGGATLEVAKKGYTGKDTKELGVRFLIYGAIAEIFARTTGFNKGLGGSMHTFFTPFGIYPNNAIVGGSGSIAVGAALYKKVNRKKGIVVANLGDGAMARGPVLEGMTFASMDQFHTLWEGDMKGGLPVLINVMDNQYAMGGQTKGETMGYTFPARLGAGFNPEAWHAERVNGYDPLAVIDAFRRKKALLEKKEGPALLDVVTYRYSGHSPSDQSSYRTKEEIAAWEAEDCIIAFGKKLIEAGVATQKDLDAIQAKMKETIFEMYKLAIDPVISPRMDLVKDNELLGDMMYSNGSVDSFGDAKPDVLMPLEENPRVKQIAGKSRFYLDAEGKLVSSMKLYNFRDGVFVDALSHVTDMLDAPVFAPRVLKQSAEAAIGAFADQKTPALLVSGSDVYRALETVKAKSPALYDRLDFATLPGGPAASGFTYGLFVNEKLSDDPDRLRACLDLCVWLTGPRYAETVAACGQQGFTAADPAARAAFLSECDDDTLKRLAAHMDGAETCMDLGQYLYHAVWSAFGGGIAAQEDPDAPNAAIIANDMQDMYERYYLTP